MAVGQRYNSLDQLVADQRAAGFVRVGYFGKQETIVVFRSVKKGEKR
ncbi:MAG: hypothetical protein JRE56_00605 [Deltaproteobacteria bacterium]|nr:hypothetical protein [Deltaproteobacteria bacterium]